MKIRADFTSPAQRFRITSPMSKIMPHVCGYGESIKLLNTAELKAGISELDQQSWLVAVAGPEFGLSRASSVFFTFNIKPEKILRYIYHLG